MANSVADRRPHVSSGRFPVRLAPSLAAPTRTATAPETQVGPGGRLAIAVVASALLHASLLLMLAVLVLSAELGPESPGIETRFTADAEPLEEFVELEPLELTDVTDRERRTDEAAPGADNLAVDAAGNPRVALFDPRPGRDAGAPLASDLDAGIIAAADALFAADGIGNLGGGGRSDADGLGISFFGTRGRGNSIAFVVDCSGSMQGRRITRAKAELVRALRRLRPRQRFAVVFYNHAAWPMPDLASGAGELPVASRQRIARTVRWVRERPAGGGTVPADALRIVLEAEPDVVFFLTDGEFDRNVRTIAHDANERGTTIHTIAFEFRGSETLLKGIAFDNDGRYRFVP